MVAYNFQTRFADAVASGQKRQTIRAIRVNGHAMPGDTLQLYTGLRQGTARKLIDPDPICVKSVPIKITQNGVTVGGLPHDPEAFARADGFESFDDMKKFFELPFTGRLIVWEP